MPEKEARRRSPKPPRWSAERRASRVISAFTRVFDARWQALRVFRRAPERFSALRPPLDSGSVKQGCKTPGANMRRGNEEVCVCLRSRDWGWTIPNLQKNRKIQGSDLPARAAAGYERVERHRVSRMRCSA
jgi:hypothetical protein